MSETGTIVIDGKECEFRDGATVLEAALANGVDIPTLCHLKDSMPTGACRMCVVEVDDANMLLPACNTPAKADMVVQTHSERVVDARKNVLGLTLASGDHNCMLCYRNGSCELQDLAVQYQVDGSDFPATTRKFDKEDVNPLILRDFSKCILCGRCVKACNEIQVNNNLSFDRAAQDSKVITKKGDVPLKDSDCNFCGECVQVCPTGALVEKKSQFAGKPWEQEKVKTTCPYCGVGCQLWLHVKDEKIVKVTGVEDGLPNKGRTCVKGRFGFDFIHNKDRLTTPLIKENGEFREASWDEAMHLITDKFTQILREDGADALVGISCARSINEDSYQMQKLFRSVFGTNNIDHCART